MAKEEVRYQTLSAELEDILLELQQENLDIDRALECYERGLELVKQLESHLTTAENRIKKLTAKYSE
ncbi:MAG TPA: exodeoxyribonuclease VII small subunit [Candidatus Saccharimonadales bacterium]|nr:exodeoxyribonuclease VII small subunit [Candidatus Saccharimonadales bacterium]